MAIVRVRRMKNKKDQATKTEKPLNIDRKSNSKVIKVKQGDFASLLNVIHPAITTLTAIYAFSRWIMYHSDDQFATASGNDWAGRMCRQLIFMSSNSVDTAIGSLSSITIGGNTAPIWTFVFTLELVLLSARFVSIQMNSKSVPIPIPANVQPYLARFGLNIKYWESLIGTCFEYYEIYDVFMRDVYVVIFLMGISVCVAVISNSLGLC